MAGERKERRRGKNKNGKYYDWKSLTQHTEQFQSEEKVLSSNDKMILLVLNFFSSIVWLIVYIVSLFFEITISFVEPNAIIFIFKY